jgi:hypothetical protein
MMRTGKRFAVLASCALMLSLADGVGPQRLAAQTSSTPAVSIKRYPNLLTALWPGDFNRADDGASSRNAPDRDRQWAR